MGVIPEVKANGMHPFLILNIEQGISNIEVNTFQILLHFNIRYSLFLVQYSGSNDGDADVSPIP